jgi:outer membrane beta-barrel protein
MRPTRSNTSTTLAVVLTATLFPLGIARAQDETDASSSESEAATTSGDAEASAEGKDTGEKDAAQEKRKLSDRIKSVQRKVFMKKGRVEIFPHFALDLNDPFFQHFIVGGAVGFHVVDSMSLEVRGGAVLTPLTVKQSAIRFVRTQADSLLENAPEFQYHADIDVLWAPFYGKISLFSEGILHFDTYITAGPGVFGTDAGLNPAANFGLGQRYFITDWLVARVELRNYLFLENRNNESDLQNLMILGFSISGFFPMSFEYEFQ